MYSVWLPLALDISSRLQAALSVIPSILSGCLAAKSWGELQIDGSPGVDE